MNLGLKRFFYPVGQGLCCREEFTLENGKKFNLVYDCGSGINNPPKRAKAKIEQYFNGLTIDALILSHFHKDHTNLVEILNSVAKVKYLLIPDLSDKTTNKETRAEYNFLLYVDKDVDKDLLCVSAHENQKKYNIPVILLEPDKFIDLLSDDEISEKLAGSEYLKPYWHLITYNYQLIVKNPKFIKKMKGAGLYDKLSEEEFVKNHVEEIAGICRKFKLVNEQSTVLFSYPKIRCGIICDDYAGCNNNCFSPHNQQLILCNCCENRETFCRHYYGKGFLIVCVYFGDYPLDKNVNYKRIQKEFEKSLEYTGTIQFPHHGSTTGNNNNILKLGNKYVFSYGFRTKHPARSSLQSVVDKNGDPIFVNEYAGYVQSIIYSPCIPYY